MKDIIFGSRASVPPLLIDYNIPSTFDKYAKKKETREVEKLEEKFREVKKLVTAIIDDKEKSCNNTESPGNSRSRILLLRSS